MYIKFAFASILIGLLMIFIITEKSIPQKISKAQIEGNQDAFRKITKNLNLTGNAVFIPTSDILTEERIFIPLDTKKIKIPDLNNDFVFSTGMDGDSIGLALPPSGVKLLEEVTKETDFQNYTSENIEEQLQTFVGLDLLKSINLRKTKNDYRLEIEKPIICNNDETICKQYPCPTCSAVLTAITRAKNKKIWIKDVKFKDKKVYFDLKEGD